MATTIAISGKGGSGKTTIAAMIIRSLIDRAGGGSVLAVDADPNACLALTLGVEPEGNIADIREAARAKTTNSGGTDRLRSFEYGIQQAITEAAGFDLLTMGRPEGPDCYCAVNNMLRLFLDKLSSQYKFVVIDNEAGMEHLSRRTTNNVDVLCIIAEPNPLGVLTAKRISDLARQLPISVGKIGVIWNRAESNRGLEGLDVFGYVPYDKAVFDVSMKSKSVFDLPDDNPAFFSIQQIFEKLNEF